MHMEYHEEFSTCFLKLFYTYHYRYAYHCLLVYSINKKQIFFNCSTAPWGPRPTHFSPRLQDHSFLDTQHSVGLLWTSAPPIAQPAT